MLYLDCFASNSAKSAPEFLVIFVSTSPAAQVTIITISGISYQTPQRSFSSYYENRKSHMLSICAAFIVMSLLPIKIDTSFSL